MWQVEQTLYIDTLIKYSIDFCYQTLWQLLLIRFYSIVCYPVLSCAPWNEILYTTGRIDRFNDVIQRMVNKGNGTVTWSVQDCNAWQLLSQARERGAACLLNVISLADMLPSTALYLDESEGYLLCMLLTFPPLPVLPASLLNLESIPAT